MISFKSYELDSFEVISVSMILISSIIKVHSSSNETSLHINACANIPSVFFLIRSSLINASNITLRLVRLETVIWTTPPTLLYKKILILSWILWYLIQNFPKILLPYNSKNDFSEGRGVKNSFFPDRGGFNFLRG